MMEAPDPTGGGRPRPATISWDGYMPGVRATYQFVFELAPGITLRRTLEDTSFDTTAQVAGYERAVYPALTGLPVIVPVIAGLAVGLAAGLINGALIAHTHIPPFIATLGMMVTARGFAKWYTNGQPVT